MFIYGLMIESLRNEKLEEKYFELFKQFKQLYSQVQTDLTKLKYVSRTGRRGRGRERRALILSTI